MIKTINTTGTVTITLQANTQIDMDVRDNSDINDADIDMSLLLEKFKEFAEDEFGLVFDERPDSIEVSNVEVL